MTEVFAEIISYYERANGEGFYLLLWSLAIIYLYFCKKNLRDRLVYPYLILVVLFINPLTGNFLLKVLNYGAYARAIWCLMLEIIIAYAIAELMFALAKKRQQIIVLFLCLATILCSGKNILASENMQRATNFYKLSDDVVEIAAHLENTHRMQPVLVEGELISEIRQYDSNIVLAYSTQDMDSVKLDYYVTADNADLYNYFANGQGSIAMSLVIPAEREEELRYRLWLCGWVRDCRIGQYDIYERVPSAEIWN